jgi:hypothetical protein
MTMDETTMEEIIRRAGTATSFSRMNNTEAKAHINWLLSNGFKYEGAALRVSSPAASRRHIALMASRFGNNNGRIGTRRTPRHIDCRGQSAPFRRMYSGAVDYNRTN